MVSVLRVRHGQIHQNIQNYLGSVSDEYSNEINPGGALPASALITNIVRGSVRLLFPVE